MNRKTLRLCLTALLVALSAAGANLKLMGSVAFDSLPAFLAAMLLGGPEGAAVGAAGHLVSAMLAGFPLTLPMHLAIAAEMAGICWLLGFLVHRRSCPVWLGALAAFLLNAFVSPLLVVVWPGLGWAACLPLLPPLVLASAANTAGAALLAAALRKPAAALWRSAR